MEMSTEKCMACCSRLEGMVYPVRLTLPPPSEKQAQKRKTAKAQNNRQKRAHAQFHASSMRALLGDVLRTWVLLRFPVCVTRPF